MKPRNLDARNCDERERKRGERGDQVLVLEFYQGQCGMKRRDVTTRAGARILSGTARNETPETGTQETVMDEKENVEDMETRCWG